jgi:hypothetical protein
VSAGTEITDPPPKLKCSGHVSHLLGHEVLHDDGGSPEGCLTASLARSMSRQGTGAPCAVGHRRRRQHIHTGVYLRNSPGNVTSDELAPCGIANLLNFQTVALWPAGLLGPTEVSRSLGKLCIKTERARRTTAVHCRLWGRAR